MCLLVVLPAIGVFFFLDNIKFVCQGLREAMISLISYFLLWTGGRYVKVLSGSTVQVLRDRLIISSE